MSTTVTLRKLNADRKLIDKEISRLVNDIGRGEKQLIGIHRLDNQYMGIRTIEQFKTDCSANWQKLNDLLIRRTYLNEKNMLAYGGLIESPDENSTFVVKVPKFVGLDKNSNDTETLTIAQAIARKKWFETVLSEVVNTIRRHYIKVENDFNNTSNRLKNELDAMLNSQFGPESTHTSKQRIEFKESIKSNYTLEIIDPIRLKDKVDNALSIVETYANTIDSIISRATETTEVEID